MAQEETFEHIRNDMISEGHVGLEGLWYETVVLFLSPGDMEDEPIEHTIRLY